MSNSETCEMCKHWEPNYEAGLRAGGRYGRKAQLGWCEVHLQVVARETFGRTTTEHDHSCDSWEGKGTPGTDSATGASNAGVTPTCKK